jgi:hypothetical protein
MEFELRYKHPRRGVCLARHIVQEQVTPAATQARAEASARAWCGEEPGRIYVSTAPAITFTCANLDARPDQPAAQPATQPAASIRR